jgi:LPS-assembly protein
VQLSVGRVISSTSSPQFAAASGLGQARSDWLVAGQVDMNGKLGLTARSLLTEQGEVRKLELRSDVKANKTALSLGYLYTPADVDEQRSDTISEISLFAAQSLSQRWNASVTARYDARAKALSNSGVAMVYRNECLQLDVSLSRRFATSSRVDPNTVFGLSVALLGFGGQSAGVAEQCRG